VDAKNEQVTTLETEVLVVGGGIAGIRAAIEAFELGSEVTLVNKGALGKDGASTWMAGGGYNAALYPPDNLDSHVMDTITAGKYLGNEKLISTFLKLAPQTVKELSRWGVRFLKDNQGRFQQSRLPGATYGRSMRSVRPGAFRGTDLRQALPHQIRRREKINVIEDLFVTDLLTKYDTVVGVLGIDLKNGDLRIFKPKSTILATGGYMSCYRFTDAGSGCTGDGHAMAYRAGAKLMDMEFIQFLPTTAIWPSSISGDASPYSMLIRIGAWLLNNEGERFMERYYPVEKERATREATCYAIASEITAGRGSPHGGVYLALNHLPRNLIDSYLENNKHSPFLRKIHDAAIDLHQDAIEVAPSAHFTHGGCCIKETCETSIGGLYAIGEVASGLDGADRLPGNALPLSMAMGIVAGKAAAVRAKNLEMPQIDKRQLEGLKRSILAPLKREEGVRAFAIKDDVRDVMAYVGFNRNENGLEAGLKRISEIRRKDLPRLYVSSKGRKFNLEWVDSMQARNMVDVAEMVLKAALTRTESRGLHRRLDYPETDPNLQKNIIIQQVSGEMMLTTAESMKITTSVDSFCSNEIISQRRSCMTRGQRDHDRS
jgi:succinate dehydrogenase/fumarate reductase flavoprotein subunit